VVPHSAYPADAYEAFWAAVDAGPVGTGPGDQSPSQPAPVDAYAEFLTLAEV